MSKNPAFQFYPSDWTRDLDDLDLEIEGAWIRICCRLWWSDIQGEMTKSLREWSNILRKNNQKTIKILKILIEKGVADGTIFDAKKITIINRRMTKDRVLREIRKESGSLGGNPKLTTYYNKPGYVYAIKNPENGQVKIGIAINPTNRLNKLKYKINNLLEIVVCVYVDDMGLTEQELHTMFYHKKVMGEWFNLDGSDIILLENTLKGKDKGNLKGSYKGQVTKSVVIHTSSSSSSSKKNIYTAEFLEFWKIYPKKTGKDAAWRAWRARNGSRPKIEIILETIKIQSKSPQWNKDGGQFIPNPSTWINQGRWEDEVNEQQKEKSLAEMIFEDQKKGGYSDVPI